MTKTVSRPIANDSNGPNGSRMSTRLLAVGGWTLSLGGVLVLLYLAYSLLYTNVGNAATQSALLERWEAGVPQTDARPAPSPGSRAVLPTLPAPTSSSTPRPQRGPASSEESADTPVVGAESKDASVPTGEAVALLRFVRPGSDDAPVHEGPLAVVHGVGAAELKKGPGHYPGTALPGEYGNFAVAGHRTTYGAPFFHLDELEAGDEIHVTARDGNGSVYRFVEQRVVAPTDVSVLGPDPLGTGEPTLTLTTCHPRFSARQRLVVLAVLAT